MNYDDFDASARPPKRVDLQARAKLQAEQLQAQGYTLHPVVATGRKLAKQVWATRWFQYLTECQDYGFRLAPGRAYLRHGCVLDLQVTSGKITAMVMGEYLHEITVQAEPPEQEHLAHLRRLCKGNILSWAQLLQGNLSPTVLTILCDREQGLFPHPQEWRFSCNCMDWADMCSHVAAVLYAFGVLLDSNPELLFTLRGISAGDLLEAESPVQSLDTQDLNKLSDIFDINLD